MSRDRTLLNPLVQIIAIEFLARCKKAGYNVQTTDCFRTKEEQAAIGASRTQVRYPYSFHNWGLAFDICQSDKNNAYPSDNKWWQAVGKIGEELGLEWGGNWSGFQDRPHFQLNAYGDTNALVKVYKTPALFKEHQDWNIVVPKLSITPKSQKRKILWMQTMLVIKGYKIAIDGIWGNNTTAAVIKFWKDRGKTVKGKVCNLNMIKKLAE